MIGERETYIRKLRVANADRDPLSLRLRLAGALSAADLHPPSLPRAAIACIRKLRDPAPGALRFEGGNLQTPRAWERAAVASLDQLVRRAARPALGYVPINAGAVVFLDRSELLACFASDWLDGSAGNRWWWRSIFETADMAALVHAWAEAPEYAPAALELLARKGEAARFIGLLGEGDVRLLLSAITGRFGLRELAAAIEVVMKRPGVSESMPEMNTSRLLQPEPAGSPRRASAPWKRWVKETGDAQRYAVRKTLLATGLMLVRAPAVVRSRSFAEALIEWYRTEDATTRSSDANAGSAFVQADSAPDVETRAVHHDAAETSLAAPARPARLGQFALDATVIATTDDFDQPAASAAARIETSNPSSEALQRPAGDTAVNEFHQAVPSTLEQAAQFPIEAGPVDVLFEAEIETSFGGVFYLINVGLFLNLYGDFTTPLQPGIDLSIWDFVALMGQRLSDGKIESDPVWALLANLAGRAEDDQPGAEFDPPDSWRLPGGWLIPFSGEGVWQFETSDNRLRVWHPEKFLVLDVPLEGDLEQQLTRETKAFKGISRFEYRFEPSTAGGSSSRLQRWLGWLTPYLRARLARAFGITEPDDVQQVVLEHHARVTVTSTHVDVSFSLEEHPIKIRLAGLDRDPGWVPAAGRYIAFHYD